MSNKRQATLELIADMMSPEMANSMADGANSEQFGALLGELAIDNIFAGLWMRPELSRRDRSLVTLGILITLRATEELHIHICAAIKNGLKKDEIAEVIYHASGYAGFPAAASARKVAAKIFDE